MTSLRSDKSYRRISIFKYITPHEVVYNGYQMCLNCGCGQLSNTHRDPLNITFGKLRLIAARNNSTMEAMAENIIATLRGKITGRRPRGNDEIVVRVVRHHIKPKMEVQFMSKGSLIPRPNKYWKNGEWVEVTNEEMDKDLPEEKEYLFDRRKPKTEA